MSWNKAAQETNKRNGDHFETDLTNEEWALIEPLLPPPPRNAAQFKIVSVRQKTPSFRRQRTTIFNRTGCCAAAIHPASGY